MRMPLSSLASLLAIACAITAAAAEGYHAVELPFGDHSLTLQVDADEVIATVDPAVVQTMVGVAGVRAYVADRGQGKRVLRLQQACADLAAVDRTLADLATHAGVRQVLPAVQRPGPDGPMTVELPMTISVVLQSGRDAAAIAAAHGCAVVRNVAGAVDGYLFRPNDFSLEGLKRAIESLAGASAVVGAAPTLLRWAEPDAVPNDPLYSTQWHLTSGAASINPARAWEDDLHAAGVNVVIVDTGLELTHEDLEANVVADGDWDYLSGDADGGPDAGDFHGTFVAGCAAARGGNNIGVSGVAQEAGLLSARLLAEAGSLLEPDQEAGALAHSQVGAEWDVSNNSWGSLGFGEPLDPLIVSAIQGKINSGRGGSGCAYFFAAGNDRDTDDLTDYDSYRAYRWVVSVAALDRNGIVTYYSTPGNNVMISAPGGEFSTAGIVSTDRTGAPGYSPSGDSYTAVDDGLQGTSFASPIVAGAAAVLFDARPDLTWRDMQHIMIDSARETGSGYTFNSSGRRFSRDYGFGLLDLSAAIDLAEEWVLVPPNASPLFSEGDLTTQQQIPEGSTVGVQDTTTIEADPSFFTEHVELSIDVSHPDCNEVEYHLTSPSGTTMIIPARVDFPYEIEDLDFTFTFWGFWGENPSGEWQLRVIDRKANNQGTLNDWSLRVRGYEGGDTTGVRKVITNVTGTAMVHVGDTGVQLTIFGSGFNSSSIVTWNGQPLQTTYVDPSMLTARVPDHFVQTIGDAEIRVITGGVESDPLYVHVVAERPVIISDPELEATEGAAMNHPIQVSTSLLASPNLVYSIVDTSAGVNMTMTDNILNWNTVSSPGAGNHIHVTVRVLDQTTGSSDQQRMVIKIQQPTELGQR